MFPRWKRRTKFAVAVPVVLGLIAAGGLAASAPSMRTIGIDGRAQAVFRDARAYTVRVRTSITTPFVEDSRGSCEGAGFLVDRERGWIVTNAHVVGQSPSEVEVAFHGGEFRDARKIYVDSFADVAVIAVDEVPAGRNAAAIDASGAVEIGEPVGVFGHPLGMYFTGTRGIVSNVTDQDGPDLIQIDATVNAGNSGGPVIAFDNGQVVGIATSGVMGDKSDRLNFATPMKDVSRILALLRQGVSPCPPRMEFMLLRDENGHTTMEVGRSLNPKGWPLEPGDVILQVEGSGEVVTRTDLTSALRGRMGNARLRVSRDGQELWVAVSPEPRHSIVERRGILLSGALIAPLEYDDQTLLIKSLGLIVHSVEPGTQAQTLGLAEWDVLENVDGRTITDLDSLSAYLKDRNSNEPVRLVLRRVSGGTNRFFDFEVRELSAEFENVGAEPPAAVAATR